MSFAFEISRYLWLTANTAESTGNFKIKCLATWKGLCYERTLKCLKLLQNLFAKNVEYLIINLTCFFPGRCYFYHTLSHEAVGQLAKIRGFLHARLKHATLHNDYEGQGVLINCLLRNYLHYNLYDHVSFWFNFHVEMVRM